MAKIVERLGGRRFKLHDFYLIPIIVNKASSPFPPQNYNDQPRWSLRDFKRLGKKEKFELVEEFVSAAHEASVAFRWDERFPRYFDKWNIDDHGWKHISCRDLKEKARLARRGRRKPFPWRAIYLDPPGTFKKLLNNASEGKPWAVGRLEHLCRGRGGAEEAIDEFYGRWHVREGKLHLPTSPERIEAFIQQIPTVRELAADYAEAIVRDPGSPQGREARQNLRDLTSDRALKRRENRRGRPELEIQWWDVTFVFEMAYHLVRQFRSVYNLLEPHIPRPAVRCEAVTQSLGFDLDRRTIKEVGLKPLGKGENQPKQVAARLASHYLGASVSFIEKTYYQTLKYHQYPPEIPTL